MKKVHTQKKILVAMSGGVDSSVVAALLVAEGHAVTGAYMKQWSDTKEVSGVCSWKEDRRDAMRVAAKLCIDFLTLDFEKEYKEWVMGYMFDEYQAGRTPNPDIMCNKFIKFGAWLDTAREKGFDYLATGHYARRITHKTENKIRFALGQSLDGQKDQTYFLHQLNQEQLAHSMFPLGTYTKTEVRSMARAFDLPTAERPESMGICFVGEVPMKDFLQQKIKKTPGKIVMSSGEVLGEHEGLAFYTIGQRHIGVHGLPAMIQGQGTKPLFVVEKRFDENALIVGYEDDPLLYKKEIGVKKMYWTHGHAPEFPLECEVRLRHRQPLQKVIVASDFKIVFVQPQRAATPGQFAVFYKDEECLGGGIIQ